MILSALVTTFALAADPPSAPADPLSPYRIPYDELVQRTIGTASKPVAFDWRRTKVQGAINGDQLYELNNFNSLRDIQPFLINVAVNFLNLAYLFVGEITASQAN